MDYSQAGSSVYGILQAAILEWVAIPFSRGSSWLRDQTLICCIAGGFFTTEPLVNPKCVVASERRQSEKANTIWSQLCDIREKTKLQKKRNSKKISGCQGFVGMGRGKGE